MREGHLGYEQQKLRGKDDFSLIPNGAPGIETRMVSLFDIGVMQGRLSLNRFVQLTSTIPAKLFGLFPRKGTIAVGSDADIVLFDPHATQTIDAADLHGHCDYTLLEGRSLRGRVEKVYLRGTLIGQKRQLLDSAMGRCYLAFCSANRRATLLDQLIDPQRGLRESLGSDIEEDLLQIRSIDYAVRHQGGTPASSTLAVQLLVRGESIAVLSMTTFPKSMTPATIEKHYPILTETARTKPGVTSGRSIVSVTPDASSWLAVTPGDKLPQWLPELTKPLRQAHGAVFQGNRIVRMG